MVRASFVCGPIEELYIFFMVAVSFWVHCNLTMILEVILVTFYLMMGSLNLIPFLSISPLYQYIVPLLGKISSLFSFYLVVFFFLGKYLEGRLSKLVILQ
jgi:hypothetical protein